MKNFVQAGNTLTLAAPYDVASGEGALVGATFGVAGTTIANGVDGEFDVCGVFDLAKKSADTPGQGVKAYWDNTNKEVTTTSTANTLIGVFTKAVAGGVVTANVRLNGSF